jgi:HlyD family secretion protein
MDIPRPDQARKIRRRRILAMSTVAVALAGVTFALSQLRPAVPTVERNLVWIDMVKRGPMVREVHGLGTLVPEEIRWIAARTQGHVERIVLRPGATVEPDSLILVLTNPDVVQAASAADSLLASGEAEMVNLRVQLESAVLAAESSAATADSDYQQAKVRAQVNDAVFKQGLISELDEHLSQITAQQTEMVKTIEEKRLAFARDSTAPQIAAKQTELDRLQASAKLAHEVMDSLNVRAGMRGVLQLLPVEVGAQVEAGANLARVADPARLKAAVNIAETQARDLQIGQPAVIDTRNGVVEGLVARVDPSVQNGTVTVDVTLTGQLPKGARPDLSVDGTIELERLDDVVFVGRPAFAQDHATVGIFRLEPDGIHATRTQVRLGRSSVNTIEIESGLQPGDRVILSDLSQWDANERIKLN